MTTKTSKRAGVRKPKPSTGSTAPTHRVTRKTQSDQRSEDARLLRKAADDILIRGWCLGNRHSYEGTVCALGALENALPRKGGYQPDIETERPSVVFALAERLPPTRNQKDFYTPLDTAVVTVADWSNYVAKSAENVAAEMIRAALKLEAQ